MNMSYYFRDKPRFSDRLRSGNPGVGDEDLMESLKRQFDQDSKTFFEPSTSPAANHRPSRERESPFDHRHIGFSRGFPFDDDGFDTRRGGGNIRSHLDDLAARHPEFADQLLGPPWGDAPFLGTPRNRRRGSGLGSYQGNVDDDTRSQASGSSAASAASGASGVSSHGEPGEQYSGKNIHQEPQVNVKEQRRNQIPQYGLRNTMDIGQHRHNMDNNEKIDRGQRSASAPPENRQTPQNFEQTQQPQTQNQRFVSRVDITPQQQEANKPPVAPKTSPQPPPQAQSQAQPNQQKNQHGNVRHIPIFVEGRDEPVVPKNVEEPVFPQQQQQRPQSPPHFHRPSHFNQHFSNNRQQPQQQWPPHYYQQHEQQPQPQTQKPNHYQQQQEQYRQQQAEKQKAQQQQQQQQQQEQEAEPPKLKQIQPKEPLERVALVQQEVDSLLEQVKQYNGNSRQAKDYMYLDEMLTRELIKLDDIETEGKPNVRQARKDAIKSIQDCIALLESKVPLPGQEAEKPAEEAEQPGPSMETEATAVEAQVPEVIPTAPIPLPPPTEQNPAESAPVDEVMPSVENSTQAAVTTMETQQDVEGQKRQAEPSDPLTTGERGTQQMDVDGSSKGSKSPRKERKTVAPKPVSEEPIPLPAPAVSHT